MVHDEKNINNIVLVWQNGKYIKYTGIGFGCTFAERTTVYC